VRTLSAVRSLRQRSSSTASRTSYDLSVTRPFRAKVLDLLVDPLHVLRDLFRGGVVRWRVTHRGGNAVLFLCRGRRGAIYNYSYVRHGFLLLVIR
jgi:hypothetical protein